MAGDEIWALRMQPAHEHPSHLAAQTQCDLPVPSDREIGDERLVPQAERNTPAGF